MKRLSELVKKWREYQDKVNSSDLGFTSGDKGECANELQAWLREADKTVKGWKLIRLDDVDVSNVVFKELRKDFREKILGTTQTEGEK